MNAEVVQRIDSSGKKLASVQLEMMVLQVVVRADSSVAVGSGHLMRCLTLAERLRREQEAEVTFVCRDLPGNMADLVLKQGFRLFLLPRAEFDYTLSGYEVWLTVSKERDATETIEALPEDGADLLVVDSYALDHVWEQRLRPYAKEIMVIDDLADRMHDCDVLLDQNFHKDGGAGRYASLVPKHCRLLLGPCHALLREEFYEARQHMRSRTGEIKRILVFYGGTDLTDETSKAVRALIELHKNIGSHSHAMQLTTCFQADIIIGGSNFRNREIKALCDSRSFLHYYGPVDNMAGFMADADLALGAGGTATWERCYMGLPTIVTSIADNQVQACHDCAQAGVIEYLGHYTEVTEADIVQAIMNMVPERMKKYCSASEHLMGISGRDKKQ